jgi:PhoPQ-activated pathogenicity-related protein
VHPETNYLITLERDHNQASISTLEDQRQKIYSATKDEAFLKAPWHKIGAYPRANTNQFASCIRIVDPYTMQTVSVLEFENGETCFSYYISSDIQNAAG